MRTREPVASDGADPQSSVQPTAQPTVVAECKGGYRILNSSEQSTRKAEMTGWATMAIATRWFWVSPIGVYSGWRAGRDSAKAQPSKLGINKSNHSINSITICSQVSKNRAWLSVVTECGTLTLFLVSSDRMGLDSADNFLQSAIQPQHGDGKCQIILTNITFGAGKRKPAESEPIILSPQSVPCARGLANQMPTFGCPALTRPPLTSR